MLRIHRSARERGGARLHRDTTNGFKVTMRVAYLVGEYPRATDTFIQREVRQLRERGVEIETISIRRPDEQEWVSEQIRAEANRTRYLLPCGILRLLGTHSRTAITHPIKYTQTLFQAWRLRQPGVRGLIYQAFYFAEAVLVARDLEDADVGHIHNHAPDGCGTVTLLASRLAGTTYSLTLHGPDIFVEPQRWRLGEKIDRAEFVACISHFARSQAMISAGDDATDHLHIVHCGIEPDRYAVRAHAGIGRRLLFVGRLARVKGWGVLIESIALIRDSVADVHLTIVGDGPDRAVIEAEIHRRGLDQHITLVGYQTESEVAHHLSETDVFVLPSFAEGVPVVLMEAMASGVPAVTTRIAGIPELIADGSEGTLVAPGDVRAFAAAVNELLSDSTLRNRMAAAGRQKVESEFNLAREVEWLHHLLTDRPAGRMRPTHSRIALQDNAGAASTPAPATAS